MKKPNLFILIFILILNFSCKPTVQPNEPYVEVLCSDDIETDDQVLNILHSLNPDFKNLYFSKTVSNEVKNVCKDIVLPTWIKLDFDGNRYCDFICRVNDGLSSYKIVIMQPSNKKFEYVNLRRSFRVDSPCFLLRHISDRMGIIFNTLDQEKTKNDSNIFWIQDTLVYSHKFFIERKLTAINYPIKKIIYKRTGCFGACPNYELEFNDDLKLNYNGIRFNKKDGKYLTTVTDSTFDNLSGILNEIDFTKLKENYIVNVTDMESGILEVYYGDNKVKIINDYALQGTYGLIALHKIMDEISQRTDWK